MDTTETVTHIGLCAGYGGIELGLQRVIRNMRSVAFCEIEAFAIANLVAKMEAGFLEPAPIWPDLKTFPWSAFRDKVDILTGGYPCQPFSSAGQRKGKSDPRHLWPWIADGIQLLRPRFCFFENVEGHISLGLSDVIEDLAGMGYRTTWGIFSASELGASHQRKRVFILAYNNSAGLQGNLNELLNAKEREEPCRSTGGCCGLGGEIKLANANGPRSWEDRQSTKSWSDCIKKPSGNSWRSKPIQIREGQAWPSRPGEQQYGWEPPRVVGDAEVRQDDGRKPGDLEGEAGEGRCGNNAADGAGEEPRQRKTQSTLGRGADGSADRMDYAKLCISSDNRTDELRMLGNGVVPDTAELAFKTLMKELLEYTE